jgi:hypothetical protein
MRYGQVGGKTEREEQIYGCHSEFVIVSVDEMLGLTETLMVQPLQQVEHG